MGKPKHQKAARVITAEAKAAGYSASDRAMTPEQLQNHLTITRRQRMFGSVKYAGRGTKAAKAMILA